MCCVYGLARSADASRIGLLGWPVEFFQVKLNRHIMSAVVVGECTVGGAHLEQLHHQDDGCGEITSSYMNIGNIAKLDLVNSWFC